MNPKNTISILGIIAVFAINSLSFASGETPETLCIPYDQMIEAIENIPKHLPVSEKNNVYTVVKNSHGALTVTIDGLSVMFFDSRDSDPKKWGSISNDFIKDTLEKKLDKIGCVATGINSYDTGKVYSSPRAKNLAQTKFNEYVLLTLSSLKK